MDRRHLWKLVGRAAAVISVAVGLVYMIYFWNLDQKLMARLHGLCYRLFCRPRDFAEPEERE